MPRHPGHNTRPHARLRPCFQGMDATTGPSDLITERSFDSQATLVIDVFGLFCWQFMHWVFPTTRYWQTSSRLVQELNVCSVWPWRFYSYARLSLFVPATYEMIDATRRRDPPWPSGYDAWLPSVSSQVRVSAGSPSGLTWSLHKCAALWRTVYGPSATGRPPGTIREE